jgi:hypothetical protein
MLFPTCSSRLAPAFSSSCLAQRFDQLRRRRKTVIQVQARQRTLAFLFDGILQFRNLCLIFSQLFQFVGNHIIEHSMAPL